MLCMPNRWALYTLLQAKNSNSTLNFHLILLPLPRNGVTISNRGLIRKVNQSAADPNTSITLKLPVSNWSDNAPNTNHCLVQPSSNQRKNQPEQL